MLIVTENCVRYENQLDIMIINSSLPCIIDCDDGTEIARDDYFVPTMRDTKGTKRALFRGRPLEGVTETNLNMFLIKEDKANPGTLKVHCYYSFGCQVFLDPEKKKSQLIIGIY